MADNLIADNLIGDNFTEHHRMRQMSLSFALQTFGNPTDGRALRGGDKAEFSKGLMLSQWILFLFKTKIWAMAEIFNCS